MEKNRDPIWNEFEVEGIVMNGSYYVVDSPRMGGKYKLRVNTITQPMENERFRARLTTLVIEQRIRGIEIPEITGELIAQANRNNDLPVHIRALRLLKRITWKMRYIDSNIDIDNESPSFLEILAWAEILSWRELNYLVHYLKKKGWIEVAHNYESRLTLQVTVDGHSQLIEPPVKSDSTQGFVAMWFDRETEECYLKSIRPAIEMSGYEAMRIDKKEHINKIDDEIIAEIRRSLFVIADFTYGETGVRGGVYYEAGFAYGLDLPVIFACRNDRIKSLHFDTRQYNHIVWDPDDLLQFRFDLYNRILATIGQGPYTVEHFRRKYS